MIRSFLMSNRILRGPLFARCQQLLQFAFGIGNQGLKLFQLRQKRQIKRSHCLLYRYQSGITKDGPNQCFKDIRQYGRIGAPPLLLSPFAEQYQISKTAGACQVSQTGLVNQCCPHPRQITLGKPWKTLKQQVCQQQAKHGIAQEFKPLVILQTAPAHLVQVGTVGQCLVGKGSVFELVPQYFASWLFHRGREYTASPGLLQAALNRHRLMI